MQELTLFVIGGKDRDRSPRLSQSVGMQITTIIGHKLLDPAGCDLREQIIHFLVVGPHPQRLHDLPMFALFLQLHLASRRFQCHPRDLGRDRIGQFSITEVFRLLQDGVFDIFGRKKSIFGVLKPDVDPVFQRGVVTK